VATRQEVLQAIENAKAAGDIKAVQVLSGILQQSQGIKSLAEPDANVGNFFESLLGGTKRLFSSAATGVEAPFTSGEEAAVSGIQRQQEITERPGASFDAVKKTYEQEGIIGAAGEVVSQVPTALAEQTPVLASIYAGFKAGASLPLPPQLKVAAGLIGSLIVPFLSMSGNNMQRKAEEDIKAGRQVDVNELTAYGTGLVQAGIERVGLGLSGVTKAMGMSIPQLIKQGGTKATERLAKESLSKTLLMGTGKLAAAEGATEVTQQMLERYYAGLPLTDEDAKKEYIEAAYAAALLGPTVGIGSRVKSKGEAQKRFITNEAKKQEKEAIKAAAREKDAQGGQEAEGQEAEGQEAEGQEAAGQEAEGQEAAGQEAEGQEAGGQEDAGQEDAGQEDAGQDLDGSESFEDLKKKKIVKTRKVEQTDTINQDVLDILGIKPRTIADKELTEDLDLSNPEVIDQVDNILNTAVKLKGTNTDAIKDYRQKLAQKKKTLLSAKVAPKEKIVVDSKETDVLNFIPESNAKKGVSIPEIQKKFKIGFNAAKDIVEKNIKSGALTQITEKGKGLVYKKTKVEAAPERVDIIKEAAEKKNTDQEADPIVAKNFDPKLEGKQVTIAQIDSNTGKVEPVKGEYFNRQGEPFIRYEQDGAFIQKKVQEDAIINPTKKQLTTLTTQGKKVEAKITKAFKTKKSSSIVQLQNDLSRVQTLEETGNLRDADRLYNELRRNNKTGEYNSFINEKENKKLKKLLYSRRPGVQKDSEVIKGLKDKKTFGQVLTTLNTKFNKSLTEAQRQLVPILLGTPQVVGTKFKFNSGMENKDGAYGTYTVKDDLIQISDKADIETVLHEGTHAATSNRLGKHITKKGKGRDDIGRRIVQLYDVTKSADTDNKFTNELENVDEFVTNALNNGEFQEFLASVPATATDFKAPPAPPSGEAEIRDEYNYFMELKNEGATDQEIQSAITTRRRNNEAVGDSVWSRFVKVVKDVVGANAVPDNVLNDVLAIAPSLFFGPNAEQQASSDKVLKQKTEADVKNDLEELETPVEKQKKTKKPDEPTSNQPKIPWRDRFFTAVFSFDAGLNNAIKRQMAKLKVDWDTIYKTLNRMSVSQALHAETIAQQFLKYGKITYDALTGQFEVENDPNSPSFEKLMKRMDELAVSYGINPKTFRRMVHKNFVARRAQSLKQYNADLLAQAQLLDSQGKSKQAKALWDDNKIIIDLSQKQINKALAFENDFPEISELHDSWIQTKNNLIEFLVESELMTQDQADEFIAVVDVEGAPQETKDGEGDAKTFSDTYVPFFREDTDKKPSDYSQTRLGDRGKYHALKGSYEPVADVFENMSLWMRDSVKRGIMNRKGIDKINAIEALPEEVQKTIMSIKERGGNPNTISMSRIIDGKRKVVNYQFTDPMYAQAFSGMDRATLSGLGFFANFSNFLRTNVVLYPLFSIAQLPQDSVSAMFSSGVRNPFKIPLLVLAEFPLTLLNMSKTHKDLQRFGATGGKAYMQNETQADLDINQPGFYNAIRRSMGKVPGLTPQSAIKIGDQDVSATGFLSRLAMASDNAVRQAVYRQTMKETGDQDLAINRAFEVINFKRGGANSMVTGLRQVVPFFGAFLQAASVQGRTITGAGITPQSRAKGVQQFLMTGAQLAGLTLLYSAMASDDEEYEKLDPTIRDRRFLLGDGAHITLRPDLFTYMFKIMPEHVLQNMLMESEDNRKTWDSMKRALKDVGMFNILPQAIRPAISLMYNYDPLTGRQITPQSAKDRVPERQITAGTSELAKLLSLKGNESAEAIGIDSKITPIEVDYFLRQYFGYTGGLITMITSSMIDEYDVFDYDRPSKSDRDLLASIPGMSAFISREYGNRHTSDYYQLRGEVNRITKAYKDLQDLSFNPKKTQEYLKDNFREITIKPLINSIQNQLTKVRQERNKLLTMPRTMITPDGKKEALDRLYEFERALLSQIKNVRKNIYGTKFEGIDLQEVK